MAKPHAGSIKRVEYAEKDPATGKRTASSPSAWTVQNMRMPIIPYAIIKEAGPPLERAAPDVTKSPVPGSQLGCVASDVIASRLTNRATNSDHLHMASF